MNFNSLVGPVLKGKITYVTENVFITQRGSSEKDNLLEMRMGEVRPRSSAIVNWLFI